MRNSFLLGIACFLFVAFTYKQQNKLTRVSTYIGSTTIPVNVGDKFFLTDTDNDTCTLRFKGKFCQYTNLSTCVDPVYPCGISGYSTVWVDQ